MCGIVGAVAQRDVAEILVEGLRRLEYRGYDSAGIATLQNGHIDRRRAEGKLINLENLLKDSKLSVLNTGNNLDRFAMVEEQVAKKYGVKLMCYPHGIEYGFKFPKCFIGDVFYTTSESATIHLNKLYNSSKFVFDTRIINLIFNKRVLNKDGGKIVFFSEPREFEVNHYIIKSLLPLLKKINLPLSLKLHPKDSFEEYINYDIEIIPVGKVEELYNILFA